MKQALIHPLPGGICPEEHKARSTGIPIQRAPLPPCLLVPLTQPRYAEAEVLVRPGERVLKGQVIARGRERLGIHCHAPTSGTVTEVASLPVPNPSGLPELCARIEPDGREQWQPHQGQPDYRELDGDSLLQRIADAGINGLGGAGFPAHIKLAANHRIHTLVINACECEPFITADDALMRERAADIVEGIRILLHILRPERCLIGIEDNKPEAQAALAEAIDDERIALRVLPSRYPSGAERQLIWILTGRELPSGTLPAASGILCQNVGTAHAIARAVVHGEPLLSRITTLTGAALARPCNAEVLIGTPMDFLLDWRGLDPGKLSRLIMGGSLMGLTLPALDLPVTKISNCLIATTDDELPAPPPAQPCIRCGQCVDACPVRLLPQQLYWFARAREHDKARAHKLFDCIECGACAYVCPSAIPLVQYYRAAKAEIREEEDRHRRGEHSKERFEFHQARLAREKGREEARRRERAEQARRKKAEGGAAQDAIQAALARVKAKKARQAQESAPADTAPAGEEANKS